MKKKATKKIPARKYAQTRADWYQRNKEQILEMQRRRREAKRRALLDKIIMRTGWVVEADRVWLTAARAEQGLTMKDLWAMLKDLRKDPES